MAESWDAEPPPRLESSRGMDWPIKVAVPFVALGWVPVSWLYSWPNAGHFGPLALPAVAAMVGLLFAVIGLLRSVDTGDRRMRTWSIVVGLVAFARIFLQPLLG